MCAFPPDPKKTRNRTRKILMIRTRKIRKTGQRRRQQSRLCSGTTIYIKYILYFQAVIVVQEEAFDSSELSFAGRKTTLKPENKLAVSQRRQTADS